MKVADVWNEAAEIAELWAAIGRSRARHLEDVWHEAVATKSAADFLHLARTYRTMAKDERREIDFDDQPTPVREATIEITEFDDDPTEPDL